jgi:hypothetical protein
VIFNNTTPFLENRSQPAAWENYVTVNMPILYLETGNQGQGFLPFKDYFEQLGVWNQVGPGKTYATVGDYLSAKLGPFLMSLLPDFIRLLFGVKSEDEAERVFNQRTEAQYQKRQFVHEHFWRTPPNTTATEFHLNTIAAAEAAIQPSLAYDHFMTFAGAGGNAFLLPTTRADLNYNHDNISYAIEMEVLAYHSLFHQENEWARKNDIKIQSFEFFKAVFSTLISVSAGRAGARRYADINSMAEPRPFTAKDYLKEIATETVIEHIIGTLASTVGMPTFFSEQFAEHFAESVTSSTKQDIYSDTKHTKYTDPKLAQQIKQLDSYFPNMDNLPKVDVNIDPVKIENGQMTVDKALEILRASDHTPYTFYQRKLDATYWDYVRGKASALDVRPMAEEFLRQEMEKQILKRRAANPYYAVRQRIEEGKISFEDFDFNGPIEQFTEINVFHMGRLANTPVVKGINNEYWKEDTNVVKGKYIYITAYKNGKWTMYLPNGNVWGEGSIEPRSATAEETIGFICENSDKVIVTDPGVEIPRNIDEVMPYNFIEPDAPIQKKIAARLKMAYNVMDRYPVDKVPPYFKNLMDLSRQTLARGDAIELVVEFDPIPQDQLFEVNYQAYQGRSLITRWFEYTQANTQTFSTNVGYNADLEIFVDPTKPAAVAEFNRLKLFIADSELIEPAGTPGYYRIPQKAMLYFFPDFYRPNSAIKIISNPETVNVYDSNPRINDYNLPQYRGYLINAISTFEDMQKKISVLSKENWIRYLSEPHTGNNPVGTTTKTIFNQFGRFITYLELEKANLQYHAYENHPLDERLWNHIRFAKTLGLTLSGTFGPEHLALGENHPNQPADPSQRIINSQLQGDATLLVDDMGETMFFSLLSDDFLALSYQGVTIKEYLKAEKYPHLDENDPKRTIKRWMEISELEFNDILATTLEGQNGFELKELFSIESNKFEWAQNYMEKLKRFEFQAFLYSLDHDNGHFTLREKTRDTPEWTKVAKYIKAYYNRQFLTSANPISPMRARATGDGKEGHYLTEAARGNLPLQTQEIIAIEAMLLDLSTLFTGPTDIDLTTPSPIKLESWTKHNRANKWANRPRIELDYLNSQPQLEFVDLSWKTYDDRAIPDTQSAPLFIKDAKGIVLSQNSPWDRPSFGDFGVKGFELLCFENRMFSPDLIRRMIHTGEIKRFLPGNPNHPVEIFRPTDHKSLEFDGVLVQNDGIGTFESLDSPGKRYVYNKMYGEITYAFLNFQAQTYVARSDGRVKQLDIIPSLIGHTAPLLTFEDDLMLSRVILGKDTLIGDDINALDKKLDETAVAPGELASLKHRIKTDLQSIGKTYNEKNVLTYLYRFADRWIPTDTPGIMDDPNSVRGYDDDSPTGISQRKHYRAKMIMNAKGFDIITATGIGIVRPFTREVLHKGTTYSVPTDMTYYYLLKEYRSNPALLVTKIKVLIAEKNPDGTPNNYPTPLHVKMPNPHNPTETIDIYIKSFRELGLFLTRFRMYQDGRYRDAGSNYNKKGQNPEDTGNYHKLDSHADFFFNSKLYWILVEQSIENLRLQYMPTRMLKSRYRTDAVKVGFSLGYTNMAPRDITFDI